MNTADAHAIELKELLKKLQTTSNGLSSSQAHVRLKQYGRNELKEGKKVSPFKIFFNQFNNIVMYILIFAVIVSAVLHEVVDAVVILVILVFIGIFGFIQEYKAEKAIEALKKMSSLQAKVLRDGKKVEIDAKELIPGDVIVLETGDKIPADARIIGMQHLETQEAPLTGESLPIKKQIITLAEKTVLGDRKNMVYSGTLVVGGKATAVVTSTGMQTEMGKIAQMIQQAKPDPTPLQKKMDQLGRILGAGTIAVASIVFFIGFYIQKEQFLDMLEFSVSLAVAAIPEGLAAVVTISLALGTQRMLKRHALIRRLPSVETLGSTTVICSDKTGTLTMNQMTVKKLFANGTAISVTGSGYETKGEFILNNKKVDPKNFATLLEAGLLNNDAEVKDNSIIGDPTEGALIVSAEKAGLSKQKYHNQYKRIDEVEFTSERKLMTTVHQYKAEKRAFTKGAPEKVLEKCSTILINGRTQKLTPKHKKEILKAYEQFANDALRVLGFAFKSVRDKNYEKNLTFLGLQAMIDPPRPDVKDAIHKCHDAGIKVVMITGDHAITAQAVAREIGLKGRAVTGADLDSMPNLSKEVESIGIFSRVNPEHKLKIVEALKKKGHVVAMTGDGVNDAPALKKADIGVAMGITGTDVSKEASSMILTDDNFASIVNAVEEGRGTYDNIRKYFSFLLSGNIAEVLVIFLSMIFGLGLPLTVTQILLINLVTDGFPALALSADPFEPNAMKRKPRKRNEPIYKGLKPYLMIYPTILTITALAVFIYFLNLGGLSPEENMLRAQTATFIVIAMFELYQAFACRSTIYPSFKVGMFKNKHLVLAVFLSFSVVAATIFVPALQNLLGMFPLTLQQFISLTVLSSIGAIGIELSKMFICKRNGEGVKC